MEGTPISTRTDVLQALDLATSSAPGRACPLRSPSAASLTRSATRYAERRLLPRTDGSHHDWCVHFVEATDRLLHLFEEAGLAPDLLQPWPAWKVFKRFLREPVEGAACDTLVQVGAYYDSEEGKRIHLYMVRQFSDELAHDLPEHDEQVAHLVCDLSFPAECTRVARVRELWSQDFPSHAAFIDAVETDSVFQSLMNAEPISSRVFWEEC